MTTKTNIIIYQSSYLNNNTVRRIYHMHFEVPLWQCKTILQLHSNRAGAESTNMYHIHHIRIPIHSHMKVHSIPLNNNCKHKILEIKTITKFI